MSDDNKIVPFLPPDVPKQEPEILIGSPLSLFRVPDFETPPRFGEFEGPPSFRVANFAPPPRFDEASFDAHWHEQRRILAEGYCRRSFWRRLKHAIKRLWQ